MNGARLRKMRKELGLSGEKIAQALNTTRVTVSRWESGASEPSDSKKVALAKVLNTSVAYLMGETDNPAPMAHVEVAAPEAHIKDDVTDFAYWGEVVNNVRRLLAQGDERIISSITPLMGLAYEMLAKKAPIGKTVVTQIGSGNNNMIGNSNTYMGK